MTTMSPLASSLDRPSAKSGQWRTEFERIYSASKHRRACPDARGPKRTSWISNLIAEICSIMQGWHQRGQSRRLLCSLDERMRKDIGLSDADIVRETSKPFWQA